MKRTLLILLLLHVILQGATTVWDKTHLITRDFLLPQADTLIIEEGVKVLVVKDNPQAYSGEVEIEIQGTIISKGSVENPVIFDAYEPVDEGYGWRGIKITSRNNVISNVVVKSAKVGVTLNGLDNKIINWDVSEADTGVIINNYGHLIGSKITNCKTGVYVKSDGVISTSTFEGNKRESITFDDRSSRGRGGVITGVTAKHNKGYAVIQISGGCDVSIGYSTIDSNEAIGIVVNDSSTVDIQKCMITYNTSCGIVGALTKANGLSANYNNIFNNSSAGININTHYIQTKRLGKSLYIPSYTNIIRSSSYASTTTSYSYTLKIGEWQQERRHPVSAKNIVGFDTLENLPLQTNLLEITADKSSYSDWAKLTGIGSSHPYQLIYISDDSVYLNDYASKIDVSKNWWGESNNIELLVGTENLVNFEDYLTEPLTNCGAEVLVPEMTIESMSRNLGYCIPGDTIHYDFKIYNEGGAFLKIDSVIIEGDRFIKLGEITDIAYSAADSIPLIFTPLELGEATGVMKIYSNDPLNPVLEVSLKGTGVETSYKPEFDEIPDTAAVLYETFTQQLSATDQNGSDDINIFRLLSAPEGMTIDEKSGLITYPAHYITKSWAINVITVMVEDLSGLSDTATYDLLRHTRPTFEEPPQDKKINVNEIYYTPLKINGSSSPYHFQLLEQPPSMTIDSTNGDIIFTPNAAEIGSFLVTVQVSDYYNLSITHSFTLTVVDPTPVVDLNKKTKESLKVYPNPVDVDAESITISIPSAGITQWSIAIYDALGSLIEEQDFVNQQSYNWDMKNRYGKKIGNGSYLLITKLTDVNGNVEVIKQMIGVKR